MPILSNLLILSHLIITITFLGEPVDMQRTSNVDHGISKHIGGSAIAEIIFFYYEL